MTHPFWVVHERTGIVHNGILPAGKLATRGTGESDTSLFASKILTRLPEKWWHDNTLIHLIEEYIGYGNKVVIMDFAGDYKILNEKAGTWENGVWYSNTGFRIYNNSYGVGSYYGSGIDYSKMRWDQAQQKYVPRDGVVLGPKDIPLTKKERKAMKRHARANNNALILLPTESEIQRFAELSALDYHSMGDAQWREFVTLEERINNLPLDRLRLVDLACDRELDRKLAQAEKAKTETQEIDLAAYQQEWMGRTES